MCFSPRVDSVNDVTDPNVLQERLEALKTQEETRVPTPPAEKPAEKTPRKPSGKKPRSSRSRQRSRPTSKFDHKKVT